MCNEKQQKILQMAKDICRVKHICNDVCNPISACDALKYAERAVEAGYCKQEWISVEERLPEPQISVLVYCFYHGEWQIREAWYGAKTKAWFVIVDGGSYRELPITHWMPLPEAPKGGDEK